MKEIYTCEQKCKLVQPTLGDIQGVNDEGFIIRGAGYLDAELSTQISLKIGEVVYLNVKCFDYRAGNSYSYSFNAIVTGVIDCGYELRSSGKVLIT